MVKVKFRYRDSMSGWKWRNQECTVDSLNECINIYGLNDSDVEYEIISIKET